MKVVINTCFGGFGLSPAAMTAYAAEQGKTVYFYEQTAYKHREGYNEYKKVSQPSRHLLTLPLFVDCGDITRELPNGDGTWFSEYRISRTDPALIRVVEKIGDAANGSFASLKVVEIPDGVSWEIDEYDGLEHIAETHRTWN